METMLVDEQRPTIWQEFVVVGEAEAPSQDEQDGVDWCDWWAEYSGVME